jgi:hypothetical protein
MNFQSVISVAVKLVIVVTSGTVYFGKGAHTDTSDTPATLPAI